MRVRSILAALGALLLTPASGWAQCAMCRTAVTGSEEGRLLAEGLNRGILLLVSVPFLLVGLFVLRVYLPRLRTRVRAQARPWGPAWSASRAFVQKVGNFTLFWKRQTP